MSLSYHYYNILCQVYIFLATIFICALMGDFFRVVIFLNVCTFVVYICDIQRVQNLSQTRSLKHT